MLAVGKLVVFIKKGNKDNNILFYDYSRNNMLLHTLKFNFEVNDIAWDPSGSVLFVTGNAGVVQLIDGRNP